MVFRRHNRKRVVVVILLALALIPVLITGYELVFTKSRSVVFLGNYDPRIAVLVICYYLVLLCLGVFWFVRQIVFIARLKNEKTKAELMLLKNQVSPHFFFNMLNNLYGLVAKDAHKAQALILKLSDMMRYSIYEGVKEKVTLREEVEFLRGYIELHRMRYHKSINVDFGCDIDERGEVTPLLFIMLLENAFKHGVENLRENAYIRASLVATEQHITFTIENNYKKSGMTEGLGLKNLKRRLELLYPDRHELSFSVTESEYHARLILTVV